MAERSSINQVVQVGPEVTPGTSVAATTRLQSVSIEPSPNVSVDDFRPAGMKYKTFAALSKEWTVSAVDGRAAYSELPHLFASVLTKPVTTQPDVALSPTAFKHVFSPSSSADDNPQTYTVEHGSGVRADGFVYGLLTELGLTITRDSIEVKGSMIGRALTDNIVMTADGDVNEIDLVPVLATQMSIYLDDTHAALGTTKLTRALKGDFSIGGRFNPLWVIDAANPSFVTHVEGEPALTSSLMLEADSQGMGVLPTLRNGDTKFLRFEAIGAPIGAGVGVNYRLAIDVALKVTDTEGFSDEDGVYAVGWTFTGVHDSDWGRALQVTVVNEVESL